MYSAALATLATVTLADGGHNGAYGHTHGDSYGSDVHSHGSHGVSNGYGSNAGYGQVSSGYGNNLGLGASRGYGVSTGYGNNLGYGRSERHQNLDLDRYENRGYGYQGRKDARREDSDINTDKDGETYGHENGDHQYTEFGEKDRRTDDDLDARGARGLTGGTRGNKNQSAQVDYNQGYGDSGKLNVDTGFGNGVNRTRYGLQSYSGKDIQDDSYAQDAHRGDRQGRRIGQGLAVRSYDDDRSYGYGDDRSYGKGYGRDSYDQGYGYGRDSYDLGYGRDSYGQDRSYGAGYGDRSYGQVGYGQDRSYGQVGYGSGYGSSDYGFGDQSYTGYGEFDGFSGDWKKNNFGNDHASGYGQFSGKVDSWEQGWGSKSDKWDQKIDGGVNKWSGLNNDWDNRYNGWNSKQQQW